MAGKAVINPGKYHLGYTFDFPPYHNVQYDDSQAIKRIRFKTAVVMNRRAYVGNVQITNYDSTVETLSDSIFKSKTNQFDTFTHDRRIDVAIGDGEDIIGLSHFADMLLQFKQNTLHIINCSGASEFLEGTFKHKGVSHPASIVSTSFGIGWANKHGIYFFDGKMVKDLFVKRGIRRISPATWSSFNDSTIRAGFLPSENQLIFINDGGDIFIYDFVTQAISQGTTRAIASGSNLVNAWDGKLIIASNDGLETNPNVDLDEIVSINTTATSNFDYATRSVDAGMPSVEKKFKTAYVTYRNAANVSLQYSGVGKSGAIAWASSSTAFTANEAEWTTTKFTIGKNAYNLQLRVVASGGDVPADFEINDMALVFRTKAVK